MARLDEIVIYPIKSFDGVSVESARVLPSGALADDRRWALVDSEGRFINGKRTARVHNLRARFDLPAARVEFAGNGRTLTGAIDSPETSSWLSEFFQTGVTVIENATAGWPDDTDSPGPTIISRDTLSEIGQWFEGLEVPELTRRFRPNLIVTGNAPFWEDRLYGPIGQRREFFIGDVGLLGNNPCRRCVVPSRHPETGVVISGFAKRLSQRREETLPPWAARDRFDMFYRLAVNTVPPPAFAGGTIRVGDRVELRSPS